MQKYLLLSLFFLSSLGVHAMEKESSSFFSSWFTSSSETNNVALSPMQRIQKDKDAFEKQLQLEWSVRDTLLYTILKTKGWWSDEVIDSKLIDFLRYCYNLNLYSYPAGFVPLFNLDKNNSLRDKCKQAQIEGYSALGAVIIAERVAYKNEQAGVNLIFITKLRQMGFGCTLKDKQLLALKLYNALSEETKQKMVLLFQEHEETEDSFFVLPHELKEFIVHCILHLILGRPIENFF